MYFMLRSIFWLGIVVLLLPIGGDDRFKVEDAAGVVSSTVSDLSTFCDRNPATCEASARAVSVFGHKVSEGARWAFAMASDMPYEPSALPSDATVRTVQLKSVPAPAEAATPVSVTTVSSVARIVPTNEPNTTIIERGTLTNADKAYGLSGQSI